MPDSTVGSSEQRNVRVNDPSEITTAIIQREIAHLSDRVDLRIDGVILALEARVDAIDKATTVFSENLVRVPTEVQKAVANLQMLMEEKFAGIQVQFRERDERVKQTALDTKVAVDAALQAAEKAVGKQTEAFALSAAKSEAAFAKQADQQITLAQTTSGALRDQLEDLKARVTRIEAAAQGQTGQKAEQHQSSSLVISVIGIGLAIISVLITVGVLLIKAGPP